MNGPKGHGYIYVKNWEKFQHADAVRSGTMPWIKLHVSLLGDDGFLALSTPDRCLLIFIWMLIGRYGNGRLSADERWLKGQAKAHKSSLVRLSEAGFIEILACKAEPKPARTDGEGSKEPKKEKKIESAASSDASIDAAADAEKKRQELELAVRTATSWLDDDPPHLVHHTIRQAWPGIADQVIAALPAA